MEGMALSLARTEGKTIGGRRSVAPSAMATARRVVRLGGMFSTELGIDLNAGDGEVARWFLAATLFGTRISAAVAERTFAVLDRAGVSAAGARHVAWEDLVELLDRGGYTRYDYRTATRLQQLSEVLDARYGGDVCAIERAASSAAQLEAELDALPGWGPVTVGVFLRELRGLWVHADPPLGELAIVAGHHLGLFGAVGEPRPLGAVRELARLGALSEASSLDRRDLECALVRLGLAHRRSVAGCPGGRRCRLLPAA